MQKDTATEYVTMPVGYASSEKYDPRTIVPLISYYIQSAANLFELLK